MREERNGRTPDPRSDGGLSSGNLQDWIRALPADLIEPHGLVQELRRAIQQKDRTLAEREREISRLHVALAFGLRSVPGISDRPREPSPS